MRTRKLPANRNKIVRRTFHLTFEILPSDEVLVDKRIKGATAHCWIVEDDPISALIKARYRVEQSGWTIQSLSLEPISVCIEDYRDRDIGEQNFREAQDNGSAVFIFAHCPDMDDHPDAPTRQILPKEIDLNEFIRAQRTVRSQGRCLFHESPNGCSEIIDAHSIQKNGALSTISRNGYVYSISRKYTDIKRTKGKLSLALIHVNSMSTFRGLCHHHDSSLFIPIDSVKLIPTEEQAFLYAYRCILKERFAKECSVKIFDRQLKDFRGTRATREMLEACRDGNFLGLSGLRSEHAHYDESHRRRRFNDIRYVIFESSRAPTAVFSGQIYPDWGFNGEPIQNLASPTNRLSLLTFSFAPTASGWALLFAWHKVSDGSCWRFISTLKSAIRNGKNVADLLFALVVKGCENTAYSPDWIERRTTDEMRVMEDMMTHGSDVLKTVEQDYLMLGEANFHEWEFNSVSDNLT